MKEKVSIELIKKAQANDEQALADIVKACDFIIISEIKKINNIDASYKEDLKQIGSSAVVDAVQSFDTTRNASFETFVTICVHNKFTDEINDINKKKYVRIDNNNGDDEEDSSSIDFPGEEPSPEDIAIEQETMEAIYKAMQKYFTKEELQIIAFWNAGYKYEEIIKELNVTQSKIANTKTKLNHYSKKIRDDAGL